MCRLYGCNICGEGGEYETLVLDCALFTHARIVLGSWSIEHLSAGDVAILHPTDFHAEPKTSPQALQGMPQGDPIDGSGRSRSSTAAPGKLVESNGTACNDMSGPTPAGLHPEAASTAAQCDGEDAGTLSGHDSGCPPARAQVYMVPSQPAHGLAPPAAQERPSPTYGTGNSQSVVEFRADAAFIRSSHALSVSCAPQAAGGAANVPASDLAEAAVDAALAEITRGRASCLPSPACGIPQQPALAMTTKGHPHAWLCVRMHGSVSASICSLKLIRVLVPSSSVVQVTDTQHPVQGCGSMAWSWPRRFLCTCTLQTWAPLPPSTGHTTGTFLPSAQLRERAYKSHFLWASLLLWMFFSDQV